MVLGPGGYRFSDFARAGLPLDVICGVITVALTPVFYPF
jgi:di/tricarboxylate transporter